MRTKATAPNKDEAGWILDLFSFDIAMSYKYGTNAKPEHFWTGMC